MAASRNRLIAALIAAALAGCDARTALLVHLETEPGFTTASQSADVSIPENGVTASRALDPAARAFTIVLPDAALDVMVTVTAADAAGRALTGSLIQRSAPHQQIERTLCLGDCAPPPPDGAPSDFAAPDGASPDGAGAPDLATQDGPAADLAARDLAPAPDMAHGFCFGPSTCATSGTALCTGFESGSVDAPFFARIDTGGAGVADSARVCRGTYSLHLTTPAATTAQQVAAYVFEQQVVPTTTLYERAFVYRPAQTLPVPTSLALAFQNVSPFEAVQSTIEVGDSMELASSCVNQVNSPKSAAKFPTGRWVCVEFEIVSSTTTNGALHLWIDGNPVSDIDITNAVTQSSPALGSVALGLDLQTTGAAPQFDLWIDELAIDTQPIGCIK